MTCHMMTIDMLQDMLHDMLHDMSQDDMSHMRAFDVMA